ncbi:hypothetical protein FACS1894198_3360 [Clostridia bacterium]|nr:hypothetical protein FACS1894198_3360 [Clostridia bacterium]
MIKSTQQANDDDEAATYEPEIIEIITKGKFEKKEMGYSLTYEEMGEDFKYLTTLSFDVKSDGQKIATIMKKGGLNTMLVIEEGKRTNCWHGTNYGNLQIGVLGELIRSEPGENGGDLELCYKIDVNSIFTSNNRVEVNFKYYDVEE